MSDGGCGSRNPISRIISGIANFLHIGRDRYDDDYYADLDNCDDPHDMTPRPGDDFPDTLAGFGYTFDEAGRLRQVDAETGVTSDIPYQFDVRPGDIPYNQRRYEALGQVITEHVYRLLVDECGLQRIRIPPDYEENKASFVFANRTEFTDTRKLLVLINGAGAVRAGQWARSLIINESLDAGTQIPYIRRALELDYDVLVLNPNENHPLGRQVYGLGCPTQHVMWVWRNFLAKSPARIAIVAHSYGACLTLEMAEEFGQEFLDRVFAVAFTDSVHGYKGNKQTKLIEGIARNYVSSHLPLNSPVETVAGDVTRVSCGHIRHEWSSSMCMVPLFEFLEEKYRQLGVAGAVPVVEAGAAADAAEAAECAAAEAAAKASKVAKAEVEAKVKAEAEAEKKPNGKADAAAEEGAGAVGGGGGDDVPTKKSKTDA